MEHGSSPKLAPAPDTAQVLALAECIVGGVRRQPGEWFPIAADRVTPLTALGYILPDTLIHRMPPVAAEMWRERALQQPALTPQTLAVDTTVVDLLWHSVGQILTPDAVPTRYVPASKTPSAIRVLQLTAYDPGSAVYRYHSAANTHPGVVSALARFGYSNPHCHLRQWDGDLHRRTVELLAMTADVIHVHMDYRTLEHDLRYVPQPHQRMAITYHGSRLPHEVPKTYVDHDRDARWHAIQFGARPYFGRWGVERYLPIPMPVADYAALAAGRVPWTGPQVGRKFRIAHSPTVRALKGTKEFEAAVDYLVVHEGLPIEIVMIEHMDHGEGLARKATCDATFDSFWLGMQGSGLEAACMGQVVLAGDDLAADEAAELNHGEVPWTFVNTEGQLRETIRDLVCRPAFYAAEVARVQAYVARWHDYHAVGARYYQFLEEALGRGTSDR